MHHYCSMTMNKYKYNVADPSMEGLVAPTSAGETPSASTPEAKYSFMYLLFTRYQTLGVLFFAWVSVASRRMYRFKAPVFLTPA